MPSTEFDAVAVGALRARCTSKWDGLPDGALAAGVAEMDFAVAPVVRSALAADVDASALGYPAPSAMQRLTELFAERSARRYGWQPDPASVMVLTDVLTGIGLAIEETTSAGDGVVLVTPAYPPYLLVIEAARRVPVVCRMVLDGGRWVVDPEALDRAASGAAAIVVCNPHNPTGRSFTRAELHEIASAADRHGLFVVSDEIHADLVYAPHAHVPFACVGDGAGRGHVVVTSASKSFGLSGLRCAVAAASSPDVHGALNRRGFYARPGVSRLGVTACSVAWSEGDPWLDGLLAYLSGSRAWLFDALAERVPGVVAAQPDATYLAWLDCRQSGLAEPAGRALEAGVSLNPGAWFGEGWEQFARLNFATSRALLAQIVDRLATAFVP